MRFFGLLLLVFLGHEADLYSFCSSSETEVHVCNQSSFKVVVDERIKNRNPVVIKPQSALTFCVYSFLIFVVIPEKPSVVTKLELLPCGHVNLIDVGIDGKAVFKGLSFLPPDFKSDQQVCLEPDWQWPPEAF